MALNYPGPYQIRIGYDSTPTAAPTLAHVLQLNVDLDTDPSPGAAFNTFDAVQRGGGLSAMSAAVDALVALIQPFYHTSTNISTAELWKYEPNSFEASFISSYDISENGTSPTPVVSSSQLIFTFRTQEGGIMKLNLMEPSINPGATDFPPLNSPSWTALANAIVADTNVWLGRDTSYPFVLRAAHPGQSEAIFKKRFRA